MQGGSDHTLTIDVSQTRRFGDVKRGYTAFLQGDVLFAKITPCMENGKMAVVPELRNDIGFGSTEFHVLRPLRDVNAKYIYHFVSSQQFRYDAEHKMTGAVGQRRVPTTYLSDQPIPLPPKREQGRIVAKIEELFSEIDKGVESLKAARELLRVYRLSALNHAFEGKLTADWRNRNKSALQTPDELLASVMRASEHYCDQQVRNWHAAVQEWEASGQKGKRPSRPERPAEISSVSDNQVLDLPVLPQSWMYVRLAALAQIGSGMAVSKDREISDPIEVPYLRVANVQRGRLDLSQIISMKIERTQLLHLALKSWDVLFNEGGDRDKLGRGWIWEEQISPCITQNHVFRASPYLPSEVHSKFISHWGNTFGRTYFEAEGKQTTNLASINKAVLSSFPVPLAPFDEQAEILRQLDSQLSLAESLQSEIDTTLKKIEALRQSILKKAFSGRNCSPCIR